MNAWKFVREDGCHFAVDRKSLRVFGIGPGRVWEVGDADNCAAVCCMSVETTPSMAAETFEGTPEELVSALNAAL